MLKNLLQIHFRSRAEIRIRRKRKKKKYNTTEEEDLIIKLITDILSKPYTSGENINNF